MGVSQVIMLGGGPAWFSKLWPDTIVAHRRNVKKLINGYNLHIAERNILAHAYLVNNVHSEELLQQLRDGRTPDNMLQNVQNAYLRKKA